MKTHSPQLQTFIVPRIQNRITQATMCQVNKVHRRVG